MEEEGVLSCMGQRQHQEGKVSPPGLRVFKVQFPRRGFVAGSLLRKETETVKCAGSRTGKGRKPDEGVSSGEVCRG